MFCSRTRWSRTSARAWRWGTPSPSWTGRSTRSSRPGCAGGWARAGTARRTKVRSAAGLGASKPGRSRLDSWLNSSEGIWSFRGHEVYCPRPSQVRPPAPHVTAREPAHGFNTGLRQPAGYQLPARLEDLPDRDRGASRCQSCRPRGRLPFPGRSFWRWEVDPGPAADPGGEALQGQDLRRRCRARQDEAAQAAVLPAQDRPGLPGLQAAAEPDRVRERGVRAARSRRARPAGAVAGGGGAGHGRPCGEGAHLSLEPFWRRAAACRHRAGAGARAVHDLPRRGGIEVACGLVRDDHARRGRSCSSFCASTREAPRSSWRRTTVRSSTSSAAALLRSTLGRLPEMTGLAGTTMMFRNLRFALNSAWQSFWRNLAVSLAAVLSITLILILGGVNLLVGHALSQVLDGFREKVSVISINIADDTPLTSVYQFDQQLNQDPRVASVAFITKDQALTNFIADPNNAALAQQLNGNPLDAKLEVRVRNLSDVASIDALARQWAGVDPTNPTNYQGEFVNRMLQLSQWLGLAGVGLMAILVIVSVVIVMNTIRTAVYHRRKEIEVMKLVGATEWFVRGPFVIEGIMTGLIAASIALSLLVIAYPPAVQQFRNDIAFIPLSYDPSFIASLARDLLLGGALLGAVGSYIGVRRFVRI